MNERSREAKSSVLGALQDGQWLPARSGDYAADCNAGRTLADELCRIIIGSDNPALFGTVARAIVESGQFGAVEVGFCARIGELI
jgi:hypothetical protein